MSQNIDNGQRTDAFDSPSDPNFRWNGPNTDIRNRPTPNELDESRRTARAHNANLTGAAETAMAPRMGEVAALGYRLGIPREAAQRFLEMATDIFLLRAAVDSLKARLDKLDNKS